MLQILAIIKYNCFCPREISYFNGCWVLFHLVRYSPLPSYKNFSYFFPEFFYSSFFIFKSLLHMECILMYEVNLKLAFIFFFLSLFFLSPSADGQPFVTSSLMK